MDCYKLGGDATKPQWSLRSLLENVSSRTGKEITRWFSIHAMRRLDAAACSLSLAGEPLMLGIGVMISPFYTSLCLDRTSLVLKSLNGTRSVSCWATRNISWTAATCIKVANALNALAEIFCAGMPTPFHCNMALSSLKFILENHTIELKWHVAKKINKIMFEIGYYFGGWSHILFYTGPHAAVGSCVKYI